MTDVTATDTPIDARTFWRMLGMRAVGVTVITAQGEDGPAGFLALSATHVTADPPSMLVSIDDRTAALKAVQHSGHFAINYLSAADQALADSFGGRQIIDPTRSGRSIAPSPKPFAITRRQSPSAASLPSPFRNAPTPWCSSAAGTDPFSRPFPTETLWIFWHPRLGPRGGQDKFCLEGIA
jgi:flavin reductase (DIM6/NTAB) family NADH-FMN oxidoreductase RutF